MGEKQAPYIDPCDRANRTLHGLTHALYPCLGNNRQVTELTYLVGYPGRFPHLVLNVPFMISRFIALGIHPGVTAENPTKVDRAGGDAELGLDQNGVVA